MTDNERNPTDTVLVLGGTGTNGSRVAERLTARGVPVRVGSRSGAPPFVWEDEATWPPVLDGVGAVFVVCQPDVGAPGVATALRAFAARAVASGVRRLVLLSARGEKAALPTEAAVRESGAGWTVLRASWFFQNFSEGVFAESVRAGELPFPAGDVTEPFLDAGDIADVAVEALTGDGHQGQVYELTGPRLLTFGDAVADVAAASGHKVRYTPTSAEEYARILAEWGLPPELVTFLNGMFAELLDGRNAHLTDDVRRVLGHAPRDFADFVRAEAAAGAWAR